MTEPRLEPPLEPDWEPAELTDTVVRGAGLAGAGFVLTQALTLGFYVALARLVAPSEFGDLAAGTLLVNVGLLFSEAGMLAALIHRKDRVQEAASTATIATMGSGLGLGLLALAASPLIGAFFDSSRIGEVAAASSGLLVLRSLRIVPEALLQRRFSFLRRMVIEPAGMALFGTSAVILTANGMGVWGLVLAYYVSEFGDVLLSWALLRWRPRLKDASIGMWRELIAYGRFGLAATALQNIEQQVPVVLLGRFAGAGPLGQFRYAARMESTAGAVVVSAASYVLFPALARISSNRERFRDASLRSLRSMSVIGFPTGLLLVPLGVPAAVIAFGEVWRDAGYAAMALAGMMVAGTLISFASETMKADGRPDIVARVRVVTLLSAVVFMIALVPLDLIGVCVGLSLGTAVGAAYALVRISPQLDIAVGVMVREAAPAAAAGLLMAAVLTPVEFLLVDASSHGNAVGFALLMAEALAGGILYLFALRLLAPDSVRELFSLLGRLVRRRKGERAERDQDGEETAPAGGDETPPEPSLP